ncbi:hypothetical protein LWS69_25300, partial [Bordetella hinzii]|nr:hypothetical protein [Bordetella hinzii]
NTDNNTGNNAGNTGGHSATDGRKAQAARSRARLAICQPISVCRCACLNDHYPLPVLTACGMARNTPRSLRGPPDQRQKKTE